MKAKRYEIAVAWNGLEDDINAPSGLHEHTDDKSMRDKRRGLSRPTNYRLQVAMKSKLMKTTQ
jgi:hypothetical protein